VKKNYQPIGVFDSGCGGLTILKSIMEKLPQYDYIYLGDNARTPYGSRSFDVVYEYTRQAVMKLFSMGCQLVILACNTASAKALRSIQQNDLPLFDPSRRVLGVIRPSVEKIPTYTKTYTTSDGLYSDFIVGLAEDREGKIWGTESNVFSVCMIDEKRGNGRYFARSK